MSVDFVLKRLSVRDFRGLKALDLDMPASIPLYLIGGNNFGKSTVLAAIALALRGAAFYKFEPEPYDFFHTADGQASRNFSTRVHLEAVGGGALPAVQGVGAPIDVHAIGAEGRETQGRLQHGHRLFGADGKPITFSSRTSLAGEAKEKYRDQGLGWKPSYARIDDIREFVPEVWLLTASNLFTSLYEWKTGPLKRLAKLLSERFLRDEWTLDHDGKARRMPDTLTKAHEFFQTAVAKFPFWCEDLKPRLEETLGRYVGRQARMALAPSVQAFEEWFAQQLAVSFAAEAGVAQTPLDRMGEGWQAAVRLASLEVLGQYEDQLKDRVVLLLEEPETHLHPHLRRKLRDVLANLAAAGWTVISCTHAPEFLDFGALQQVTKLQRDGDNTRHATLTSKDLSDAVRWQEKIEEHRSHEFLFANRVVFCEGKDDEFAVRWYLERCRDLDGLSVSVLQVGGRENLPDFARAARAVGVPWCALIDEDRDSAGVSDPKAVKTRKELAGIQQACDLALAWPRNLEACVGCEEGKARPEWLAGRFAGKGLSEVTSELPGFADVCRAVAEWIPSASAPDEAANA